VSKSRGNTDLKNPTAVLAELKAAKAGVKKKGKYRIRVGMATCGVSAGAGKVYDAFVDAARESGVTDMNIIPTGCVGRCDLEPMAEVTRDGEPPVLYIRLNAEKAKRIVREHIVAGSVVEEYAG
jgi:NADP-reducing hydrogenase subunit HndB